MSSTVPVLGFFTLLLSISNSARAGGPVAGDVIEVLPMGGMTAPQVSQLRTRLGLTSLPATHYGVRFYKIQYFTPDLSEQPALASGLLVVPQSEAPEAFPIVSYQHGTTVTRTQVPSHPQSLDATVATAFYGGSGYVVAAADYLGLGDSAGPHPYLHARTQASAAADLLRATRHALHDLNVPFSDQLFLAGYSQGGHVTMSLHRHLQQDLGDEFRVTASAAMAGPFDLSNTSLQGALQHPSSTSSLYTAYVIQSMNQAYRNLYATPSEVFQAPFDRQVEKLFDGTHSTEEVISSLPGAPQALLRPDFLASVLSDPNHPLNRDLRDNDVYDWKPEAPVALMHSKADRDVPFHNSEIARDRMTALGANIELVDLGETYSHTQAAGPALYLSLNWFNEFKSPPSPDESSIGGAHREHWNRPGSGTPHLR